MPELREIDVQSWTGLFGPADLPSEVTDWWNEQLAEVMAEPELIERFALQYASAVVPTGSEDFAFEIANDLAQWKRVIREADIEAP